MARAPAYAGTELLRVGLARLARMPGPAQVRPRASAPRAAPTRRGDGRAWCPPRGPWRSPPSVARTARARAASGPYAPGGAQSTGNPSPPAALGCGGQSEARRRLLVTGLHWKKMGGRGGPARVCLFAASSALGRRRPCRARSISSAPRGSWSDLGGTSGAASDRQAHARVRRSRARLGNASCNRYSGPVELGGRDDPRRETGDHAHGMHARGRYPGEGVPGRAAEREADGARRAGSWSSRRRAWRSLFSFAASGDGASPVAEVTVVGAGRGRG